MGLMDKMKKILFDEEDIEVPITSEELPERKPKKVEEVKKEKDVKEGFIDYHHDEEEEDVIKEIIVPKEEKKEELPKKKEETRRFQFPVDDFDVPEEKMPSRSSRSSYSDFDRPVEKPSVKRDYTELNRFFEREQPKKDNREDFTRQEKQVNVSDTETKGKKPFQVTPIISPVFGILDKNYKPEEIPSKKEVINKVNNGIKKDRQYGPVSYNDEPLPKPHSYASKEKAPLKEELVELNTTISELINDTVTPEEVKEEIPVKEPTRTRRTRVKEEVEEDPIIETENYDEMTSSIENEYVGNTTIEDAFETTKELEDIREADKELEEETEEIPDDEQLEDTIETDLFNLIDSMYKSDEQDDGEEDE